MAAERGAECDEAPSAPPLMGYVGPSPDRLPDLLAIIHQPVGYNSPPDANREHKGIVAVPAVLHYGITSEGSVLTSTGGMRPKCLTMLAAQMNGSDYVLLKFRIEDYPVT